MCDNLVCEFSLFWASQFFKKAFRNHNEGRTHMNGKNIYSTWDSLLQTYMKDHNEWNVKLPLKNLSALG